MCKTLLVLVALLASAGVHAGAHESARGDAATGDTRQARVAGGSMMELAASSRSDAEWAERRPDFDRLKPRTPDD